MKRLWYTVWPTLAIVGGLGAFAGSPFICARVWGWDRVLDYYFYGISAIVILAALTLAALAAYWLIRDRWSSYPGGR